MSRQWKYALMAAISCAALAAAGARSVKTTYMGGTAAVPAKTQGALNPEAGDALAFEYQGGTLTIPDSKVNRLSYGEVLTNRNAKDTKKDIHVSKSVAFGVGRMSGKRHYLTVEFTDPEGKDQSAVFDIDRHEVRATVEAIEAHTGKQVVCEDKFARKTLRR